MRAARGDGDREATAPAVDAFDAHGAAVQPRQLLDQREADAGAFVGAPARALDPVEAVEEARQLARGDADAGVPHGELDGWSTCAKGDGMAPSKVNLKALERRLRTIFSHISRST